MEYLHEKYLEKVNAKWLTQFLTLSFVAIFLPFFIHQQVITGPIVNAILILALFLTGLRSALLISCLPSFMALAGGLLPTVLMPTIPFIIVSNMLFVLVINFISNKSKDSGITEKNYFLGTLSAAVVKFVFLLLSVNIIAAFFIPGNLVATVGKMMGIMQLLTAIIGACLAYPIVKFFQNKKSAIF